MDSIIELNDSNYGEVTGSGVAIVAFYAVWCVHCESMAPMFAEAIELYGDKAAFARIDVDKNQGIAADNKIMSIPTLLFYKDGKVADRVSGALDKAALYGKIDALL